jgi:membrane-associated phospholipid phosphatase
VVLLANKPARSEAGKITLIYTETLLINAALTNLTKELVKRKRPYNYNPNAPLSKKQEPDATSSFFSGHTSFTASSSFFLAKVYADTNPNSKWKPLVWTGAATLPLTSAIFRVAAGKHFPTDVLVGYIVGAVTGFLVPHIHKVSATKRQ